MNYCSLEDAWGGNCNQISNQYDNYMVEKNYKKTQLTGKKNENSSLNFKNENFTENFTNTQKKSHTQQNSQQLEKSSSNNFNHYSDELYDCDSFINHIHNCRKCNNRLKNYYSPRLVEKFNNIVEDNKDTIVLILIGISILLFFNLLINMTKSN